MEDVRKRLARMAEACGVPSPAEVCQDHEGVKTIIETWCADRDHRGMLDVIEQFCASRQSETYLTAKDQSSKAIVGRLTEWVWTGDFWPEEAFNYGCH